MIVLGKHLGGVTANSHAFSSTFDPGFIIAAGKPVVLTGLILAKNGVILKIMGC